MDSSRSATLAGDDKETSATHNANVETTPRNSATMVRDHNDEKSTLPLGTDDDASKHGANGMTKEISPDGLDAEKEAAKEETPVDDTEYPHGVRLAFIIVALVLSIFLIALDMTIIATAIPKIEDDFGGLDKVGWYGAAFFATVGAFQSTWGKAFKYFPLKLSYLIAIVVFEVGSLICAVAPSSTALIVGRAIAGVGAGERAMLVPRLFKDRYLVLSMIFVFFIGGGFFLLLYYLPIYFQVVFGVSASQSGVRNLPLILAVSLFSIVSGGTISATGHFIPLQYIGSIFAIVGCGLIYTLDVGSSSGKWIGYQVIAGIGFGLAFQIPIIVAQGLAQTSDLASVTAMVLFFQTIGGAFFVAAGSTALSNTIMKKFPKYVPSIPGADITSVGVTELRKQGWSHDEIRGIEHAYMDGLKIAYAISIAATGVAVVSLLGYGIRRWKNLKRDGNMSQLGGGG